MAAKRIAGVIGLGLVGTALARRLIGAGFDVVGYDVEAGRRDHLAALGGRAAASIAELARACEHIFVAVFNTDQVEAVAEGAAGVLATMTPARRTLYIVSTCDPDRIAALAARTAARELTIVEVPLSGTSEQIARGDGVGLIGGERAQFDAASALLDAVCPRRYFVGALGNGGKTKLAVNLILGLNRAALAEGLVFAERLGLDPKAFLEVARGSAAYSQIMDIKGDKMVQRDYASHGKIAQALKDVHLMLDYAGRAQQALPLTQVAQTLLAGCVGHGEGDWDNCAVIEDIRRRSA